MPDSIFERDELKRILCYRLGSLRPAGSTSPGSCGRINYTSFLALVSKLSILLIFQNILLFKSFFKIYHNRVKIANSKVYNLKCKEYMLWYRMSLLPVHVTSAAASTNLFSVSS